MVTAWDSLRGMNISDAAAQLGVSPDTIRRRIKEGTLKAEKVRTPQGYRWEVDISNAPAVPMQAPTQDAYVASLLERIDSLERELEARRLEVQQLHAIMGRKALPGPSWWQRLFGRRI
jgi:excisionase family DNA binding protein